MWIIKIIKIKCFYPPRILDPHWGIYSCLQIPPRENWFQYVRRVYATAINFPCISALKWCISLGIVSICLSIGLVCVYLSDKSIESIYFHGKDDCFISYACRLMVVLSRRRPCVLYGYLGTIRTLEEGSTHNKAGRYSFSRSKYFHLLIAPI